MPNNCEKCGAPLKEGAKFCTSCGAKVANFLNSPQNEINQANNMQNVNR